MGVGWTRIRKVRCLQASLMALGHHLDVDAAILKSTRVLICSYWRLIKVHVERRPRSRQSGLLTRSWRKMRVVGSFGRMPRAPAYPSPGGACLAADAGRATAAARAKPNFNTTPTSCHSFILFFWHIFSRQAAHVVPTTRLREAALELLDLNLKQRASSNPSSQRRTTTPSSCRRQRR